VRQPTNTTLDIPIPILPKRVLVVDDSPTMRAMMTAWLEEAGYEVRAATDGEDGAAKVKSEHPDLVIADVNMPRRYGFALCRLIKDDPATREIPVILFTRLDEAGDIVNGLAAGADAFVCKGSGAKDLLRQIESVLPDAPDRSRRQSSAVASLRELHRPTGPAIGRKAIFRRLFHAVFREVPFDILAFMVDVGDRTALLLGSLHELSGSVADELTARMTEAYTRLAGREVTPAELDPQLIVIDHSGMWGGAADSLARSVTVPILVGEDVIGCLGVFSFEDHAALDANLRFFFDIGVATARALRR
jgi:CheY-like chemotaxis protein